MRVQGLERGLAHSVMHGMHRHQNPSRPDRTRRDSTVQASTSSLKAGALEVTTDDGDKVSISFALLNQLSLSAASKTASDTSATSSSTYSINGLSMAVSIDGSLDSEETADISELMQSLFGTAVSGQTDTTLAAGSLDSLDSFQFAYMEGTQASVSVYA